MVSLYPSQLECIALSRSVTLGTEAGQPECIVLSRSVTHTRYRGQSTGVHSSKVGPRH